MAYTKIPAARQQQQGVSRQPDHEAEQESSVQPRRGVSLGPMEIQHGSTHQRQAGGDGGCSVKPFSKLPSEKKARLPGSAAPTKLWLWSNAKQPLDKQSQS